MSVVSFEPIGQVESPFATKFGVPRQSGLANAVQSFVRVDDIWCDALTGLEAVSHVWVIFVFDRISAGRGATRARPPRLGGNARVGVFATRSTHRPNGLGLSLVRVRDVLPNGILVEGLDVVDGTPVVDIKPYLPWLEAVTDARNDISPERPERCSVRWSAGASRAIAQLDHGAEGCLLAEIESFLCFEARPAYHTDPERQYSTEYGTVRVRWCYPEAGMVEVTEVVRL